MSNFDGRYQNCHSHDKATGQYWSRLKLLWYFREREKVSGSTFEEPWPDTGTSSHAV